MMTNRRIQTSEVVSLRFVPAVNKPAPHRALLVEDHAALAEATAELMRLHGLEVRIAASGGDALEMAEEFNPVLILCDMRLPDMAGLDLAEALRARCRTNDLLIAIITATSLDYLYGFEDQTKTRGVDLFLSKPLTNEALSGLLSQLEVLYPR
jgi:CheY-like chemotaxis protein